MNRYLILAAALLPACASAPPVAPPAPRTGTALSYADAASATHTYAFADSSGFKIQGGAIGNIDVKIGTTGTAAVAYAQSAGGLQATITVTDFAGAMTNSAAGGGPSATETDITGAAVVAVAPTGTPSVTSMPALTKSAESVGLNRSFFRRFFIKLPGGTMNPGATWLDTLTFSEESGGTKVEVRDIQTSAFVKDTVVNGRTLAVITTTAARVLKVTGVNEGVQIAQNLTGTTTGRALWDAQRHVLVERSESSELSGTFDLPQMGMTGLPVTASSASKVTLR